MQTNFFRHILLFLIGVGASLPAGFLGAQSDSVLILHLLDSAQVSGDSVWYEKARGEAEDAFWQGRVELEWAQNLRANGQAEQAAPHFEKAVQLFREADVPVREGDALRHQGVNFFFQGRTSEAFDKLFEAAELMESTGDTVGLGWVYRNIGSIYNNLGQERKAVEYHLKALDFALKRGDIQGQADTFNNLGNAWKDLEEFDRAEMAYALARKAYQILEDERALALNDMNLGILYTQTNRLSQALEFLESARIKNEALGNTGGLVKVFAALGHAHNEMGHIEEVIKYSGGALEMGGDGIDPFNLVGINMDLAKAYARKGEYKKAYFYQEAWTIQNNTVHNADITEQISLTEARYQEIKSRQELRIRELEARQTEGQRNLFLGVAFFLLLTTLLGILLFRNIRRLNRISEEKRKLSEQALLEKETLLREIHHRVKNNLQVISSILNLQTRFIEDEKAVEAIQEGRNRVKAMALIHQELYQLGELAAVDLSDYLGRLCKGLLSSWPELESRVRLRQEVDPLLVDIDTALPIALIVNELISNSLKHAFQDGKAGEVRLRLRQEGDTLLLEVEDTGPGIPPEIDFDPRRSFGMKLISILAQKLKAKPEIIRSPLSVVRLRITHFQLKPQT